MKNNNYEAQIKVLEDKFATFIPNPFTGKYDSKYYALKNKIAGLKKKQFLLNKKQANYNWLAQ